MLTWGLRRSRVDREIDLETTFMVSQTFWNPSFEITEREDGTILMQQVEPLAEALPTIADYLDFWADKAPDRLWLARRNDQGQWDGITYGQARLQARRLGGALLALGLGPDRPLIILSGNSLEHGICGLACLYVGIPYAPLSTAYSLVSKDHAKLRDIVDLLRPGAFFADDTAQYEPAIRAVTHADTAIIGVHNLIEGALDYQTLVQGGDASGEGRADAARAALTRETVLKYLFTSGSTGSPKAVISTNGNLTSNQAMVRDCYRFLETEPPIVLDWAPWNHTAAGSKLGYMILTNGGTYYIDDGKPTAQGIETTVQNLRDIACTWYFNVPAGFDRLVDALEADAALANTFFSRLKMLFYAGAGMSQQTYDRLSAVARATTGKDILISSSLGATETGPFTLTWTEIESSAGKVGIPGRGITLKLVGDEDRYELRVKSPSITPGYYGDPEATAKAFDEEGFYKMGDAIRPEDPSDLSRGFFFDGRLAENFKLTTGTWVSVGAVRTALVDRLDGLVRDAIIVGEDKPELGALLWLSDAGAALSEDALFLRLQAGLAAHAQAATGSARRVCRVAILQQPPSFDAGELTEKGSINQRALRRSRRGQIDALYAAGPGVLRG